MIQIITHVMSHSIYVEERKRRMVAAAYGSRDWDRIDDYVGPPSTARGRMWVLSCRGFLHCAYLITGSQLVPRLLLVAYFSYISPVLIFQSQSERALEQVTGR